MQFDLLTDFPNVIDGAESVTLLRRGSDPGGVGIAIAHALRCAATTSEATIINSSNVRKSQPSDGQYLAGDVLWHLPIAEIADAPRLGDAILDAANQRWTILAVKRVVLGSRWRCVTRNLVIAHHLDDTITLLKARYVKTACGAAEPLWQTWRTGIRARIQPAQVALKIDAQTRQAVQKYHIFVAEDLEIDATHCILGPDGATYRITSSLGDYRIGELQVLEAEAIR
jgi:predicted nucleic acid-binding Zn ribbon protein